MYEKSHFLYLKLDSNRLENFMPAWAAYRGMLTSPRHDLKEEVRRNHLGLSPYLNSLFSKRDMIKLEKELALEQIRLTRYPDKISRLNCIYTWPDPNVASLVEGYWAEKQGEHFNKKYLVEVDFRSDKQPTIADSRWIDSYVIYSNQPLEALGSDWIDKYWSGEEYAPFSGEIIPSEPLWECLIDGVGFILGSENRMRGFEIIKAQQPDTLPILETARHGVELYYGNNITRDCARFGSLVPLLTRKQESLKIRFFGEFKKELCNQIIMKHKELMSENDDNPEVRRLFSGTIRRPDLTPLEVDLMWLLDGTPQSASILYNLQNIFLSMGGEITEFMPKQGQ